MPPILSSLASVVVFSRKRTCTAGTDTHTYRHLVCTFSLAKWMLRLLNLNLGFGSSSAIVTVNFEEVKSFT